MASCDTVPEHIDTLPSHQPTPDEMAVIESALPDADEPAQITKLDLAKYRTGDFAERLAELLSVPEAFRKVIKAAAIVGTVAIFVCCLIAAYSEMALIPKLAVCAYALGLGVVFGFLLGLLRVVSAALQNVESILQAVLEITRNVATDYEQLQSGKVWLPTGGELVEQVYDEIVMPVMERSVAQTLGFLGKPLLWLYRRTIGRAVRYVVKRVNRIKLTKDDEQTVVRDAESRMAALAKYSERIKAYTASAAELVGNIGKRVRRYAMLPMYMLFCGCLALAVIPIAMVTFLAGG